MSLHGIAGFSLLLAGTFHVDRVIGNPSGNTSFGLGIGIAVDDARAFVTGGDEEVYAIDIATGNLIDTLADPGGMFTTGFGRTMTVSSGYLLVSAPAAPVGGFGAGALHVYDATTLQYSHEIPNPEPANGDGFGSSMAADGGTVVVGARFDDGNPVVLDTGSAYVFEIATGALLHTIPNPDPDSFDQFGAEVAIRGDVVAVGASRVDVAGVEDAGAVYLFDVPSGALVRTITDPGVRQFGISVAIAGGSLIVGDPLAGLDGLTNVGALHVFDLATGAYVRRVDPPEYVDGSGFGHVLASDGAVIATLGSALPCRGSSTDSKMTWTFDASGNPLQRVALDDPPLTMGSVGFGGGRLITGGHTAAVFVERENQAPTSETIVVQVNEDASVLVDPFGTDPDGDCLRFTVDLEPQHGGIYMLKHGLISGFTYAPEPDFNGTDNVRFEISDSVDVGHVDFVFNVLPMNDEPDAGQDVLAVAPGANVFDLLANDHDPDGDALSVSIVTEPTRGTVVVNADQTVSYRPNGLPADDSFIYEVSDGELADQAKVTLTADGNGSCGCRLAAGRGGHGSNAILAGTMVLLAIRRRNRGRS